MNPHSLPAVVIRPERAADGPLVRATLEAAFVSRAEAELVDWLRAQGELVLALVAERAGGGIVGFVGFPRLVVTHAGVEAPAVALAPIAVAVGMRGQGLGAALVEEGLARLASCNEALVFVVGDPAYYRRFGFDAEAARSFESPYSGTHFMVRRLAQDAPAAGVVHYPGAFADLA